MLVHMGDLRSELYLTLEQKVQWKCISEYFLHLDASLDHICRSAGFTINMYDIMLLTGRMYGGYSLQSALYILVLHTYSYRTLQFDPY